MTGAGEAPTDLADVLTSAAEDLAGVEAAERDGVTTWIVGATTFVVLSGNRAEFRLDPLVARAGLRTPDTEPSARGPDWIAFLPTEMDEQAVDRAEAWFLSAHRRAAKGT